MFCFIFNTYKFCDLIEADRPDLHSLTFLKHKLLWKLKLLWHHLRSGAFASRGYFENHLLKATKVLNVQNKPRIRLGKKSFFPITWSIHWNTSQEWWWQLTLATIIYKIFFWMTSHSELWSSKKKNYFAFVKGVVFYLHVYINICHGQALL